MIRLETDRLILRNFTEKDINDFYEYMSLESTARYEDFDPKTYEECIYSLKGRIPRDNIMAVILKESGKLIGDVHYSDKGEYETYEIGYHFNEKFWNNGYATEACIAMLDYIFNELGGRRIYAECNEDNYSSIKLLERLGMRREGHFIEDVAFKKDSHGNPIYENGYSYAILKKEWHL